MDFKIKKSFAATSPSGRSYLVYIEAHVRDPRRQRCTVLSEVGTTPLVSAEHYSHSEAPLCAVVTDFVDDNPNSALLGGSGNSTSGTWLCVFHGEELLDSVGRAAIGQGATVLTSYPLALSATDLASAAASAASSSASNNGGGGSAAASSAAPFHDAAATAIPASNFSGAPADMAPRVSPLYGVRVRTAIASSVTGAYVSGAAPATWKVPLATRARSITGEWCFAGASAGSAGSTVSPIFSILASQQHGGVTATTTMSALSLDAEHQHQQQLPAPQPLSVNCWAVQSPFSMMPVFIAGAADCGGDGGLLDGAVVAEFVVPASGLTVVAHLCAQGVLRLFAVETTTIGGDAIIWHPIAGELRLCDLFSEHFAAAASQQDSAAVAMGGRDEMESAPAGSPAALAAVFMRNPGASSRSNGNGNTSGTLGCDRVTCEPLPTADPSRFLLALKLPAANGASTVVVVVVETPPLFTIDAFFPLVEHGGHPRNNNNNNNNNNNHHGAGYDDDDDSCTGSGAVSAARSVASHSLSTAPTLNLAALHHGSGGGGSGSTAHSSRSASVSLNQLGTAQRGSAAPGPAGAAAAGAGASASTTMFPSPSPNRRFAFHSVTVDAPCDSVVGVFSWCPLRISQAASAASPSGVAPFLALLHADGSLTVHGRGTTSKGARALDLVATIPPTSANNGLDGGHLTAATQLRGSFLMLRDRASQTWSVARTLPFLAAHSIEHTALMALRAVLPQHFERLYRGVVAGMLAALLLPLGRGGGGGVAGGSSNGSTSTFASIAAMLQLQLSNGQSSQAATQQEQQQQELPAPGGRRRRAVFTPWAQGGAAMLQAAAAARKSKSCDDNIRSPAAAQQLRPLEGLTRQALQLAAVTLHVLAESLKANRFYNQRLDPLSRLVLQLAEAAQLANYTAFYRELLQLPPAPTAAAATTATTADAGAAANNNSNTQPFPTQPRQFVDPMAENNGNDDRAQQHRVIKSRRQVQQENGASAAAAAAAAVDTTFATWDDLAQFFDGLQLQQQQRDCASSPLSDSEPLDLLASLRWMAEGIAPPTAHWPTLKTFGASSSSSSSSVHDPFRDAAAVFAFFKENSGVAACLGDGDEIGAITALAPQFFPEHMTHGGKKAMLAMAAAASALQESERELTFHAERRIDMGDPDGQQIAAAASSAAAAATTGASGTSSAPSDVIDRAVHLGWDTRALETKLPAGIARPVHEAIVQCAGDQFHRQYRPSHQQQQQQQQPYDEIASEWCPEAIELIGRHDILLAAPHKPRYNNNNGGSRSSGSVSGSERRVQREAAVFAEALARHVEAAATGSTLLQILETEAPAGPFSQVRTERVHTLLSATAPIPLPANIDSVEAVQTTLPLLVRRAVALAVGRGMLTAATHNFRERDRVPVPPLVLTGLTADGLVIQCDARLVSADSMRWPTFHNACAAALRFLPLGVNNCNGSGAGGGAVSASSSSSSSSGGDTTGETIPRHWIVHQARDTQHRAGVLLAVGVLGHLCALQLTDIYSIFVAPSAQDPQREPLAIAMLLGLGCSFRRSRSEPVFRCIAVHLQALTPNGEDVEVSLDVQCAALIALGLVFEGSAQSFLVDMLLTDMGRPPSDQLWRQREGYAVAGGAALGLLLLGHGRNHNLAHLGIEERLLAMLRGDRRDAARPQQFRPDSVFGDVTEPGAFFSQATSASSASSFHSPCDERFLTRALVSQARAEPVEPCNTVSEGSKFNPQITGPAAAVALGLMFIRTRDETIARQLDLPPTLPLLDAVSPQLSLLRTLCAGLVRWQSDFAQKWLAGAAAAAAATTTTTTATSTGPDDANGGVDARRRRMQAAAESLLPPCLVAMIPLLKTSREARELDSQAQYRCLHLGFAHAGSALAIGMVHAGTLLADVKAFLLATLQGFAAGEVGATGVPQPMLHKKSHAFDACLASSAIAVSLVCAGTGDAEVLRVLVGLLRRGGFMYGTYMALSAAIGLLFLGGGRCTLSNSPESVASLLLAFYPVWPGSALDNAFHLQALRHLYAMSVVPRWLSTFDVDTGRPVATSARLVTMAHVVASAADDADAAPAAATTTTDNPQNKSSDVAAMAASWTPLPKLSQSAAPAAATAATAQQQHQQQQQQQQQVVVQLTSFPVVTPCLLPEVATIERIEIREPGFFTLSVSNTNALHSRCIGVKRKPQLMLNLGGGGGGSSSLRNFGNGPWDAAIRDALLTYTALRRRAIGGSGGAGVVSSATALQDLGLLIGPLQSAVAASVGADNASGSSTSSSSSSNTAVTVITKLRGLLEQTFVQRLFATPSNATGTVVDALKGTATTPLTAQHAHALRFSNMHLWSARRRAELQRLCDLVGGQRQGASDEENADEELLGIATRGRFLVPVVAAMLSQN